MTERAKGQGVGTLAAALFERFRAAGLSEARLDARHLIEGATGLDRAAVIGNPDRPVAPEAEAILGAWAERRLSGEPVWRIIGTRDFWGLRFALSSDVLDPRPDTEAVVSAALDVLGDARSAAPRIADLGVGSGAILAALLSECPDAVGWGVDRSPTACAMARRNGATLGLSDRMQVVNASWSAALAACSLDLVVSNPPYIETAVIPTLDREVRDHDPRIALDGGSDGLDAYRAIAADLGRVLVPRGAAVLELGAGQAAAVRAIFAAVGIVQEETRLDLGGHVRAIVLRKP